MSKLFSTGIINSPAFVYLFIKRGQFFYNAYISNSQVVFRSLDPNASTPALFSLIINSSGTVVLGYGGGYLSLNGQTIQTLVANHQFTAHNYNLTPGTIYGGVYYSSPLFNPIFSQILVNGQPPFGGSTSATLTDMNPSYVQFAPVSLNGNGEGTHPTVYDSVNGSCLSPTSIDPFLSSWMKGDPSVGCTPGASTVPGVNGCMFTTQAMCETGYIPPYCTQAQICGNCLGTCPVNSIDDLCVYDYSTDKVPHYSCNPQEPEPPKFENTTYIIIAIIVFVILIIILIAVFVAIFKNIKK